MTSVVIRCLPMQGRHLWNSFIAIMAVLGGCSNNNTPDQSTNSPPVLEALALTTQEDTPVTQVIPATDADEDPLTFLLGTPMHGVVVGDGTSLTYTPVANYVGTDTFEVVVSDGVASATATVTVTITAVNDAPVATDDSFATPEDTALALTSAQLVSNDADPDGDTLTVATITDATNGTVALSGDTIVFTPAADFAGNGTFTYTVSDGTATDTGLVTINVGGQNDAPVAGNDSATTDEDTMLALTAATLLANDSDPDAQSVTITAVGNPTNGTVALAGTDITFIPATNFAGTATFEYTASDGALSDTAIVTVTIAPINDAPVAVDDGDTTDEDTTLVIPAAELLANDTDVDGDTLTVTAVANAQAGTVALSGTNITFTPAANFVGTTSFQYTVSDGNGGTDTGLVSITFNPVNDPPVANGESVTVPAGSPTNITIASLMSNDSDPEGATLMFVGVSNASNGSVSAGGGNVTFTPAPGFVGSAGFSYAISDGSLLATANVIVTVISTCGDGVAMFDEECDDGGPDDTDGCTTQCKIGAICNAITHPDGDRFAADPFTGHCFVAYDDELWMHSVSQAMCAAEGGYLPTITSSGEQAVVTSIHASGQSPWIGATDEAVEGTFDWLTDEALGYTNYAQGQPDDDLGVGDCLHLFNPQGEWNDTACGVVGFVRGRMCEYEPEPCGDAVVEAGETCDDGNATSGDGCNATCQIELPFFSEYVEGSANNKAIEIWNPSSAPFDLGANNCRLFHYSYEGQFTLAVTLSGVIPAKDVIVICNHLASAPVLAACDVVTNSSVLNFDGDEALALLCNDVPYDVIGQIGFDPGSQWGVGLTSTADNTLRRNCSVTAGDPDGSNVFDPAIEWTGFATDTFTGLGVAECK